MMSHKSSSHRAFTPGRILAAAAILALGLPAFASLVVLQDSRTLQVRSFRVENDEAVVELSTGGWMRFPSEMVRGVAENGAWEPPPPPPAAAPADAVPETADADLDYHATVETDESSAPDPPLELESDAVDGSDTATETLPADPPEEVAPAQ